MKKQNPSISFIGMRAGEERAWEIASGVKMTFCWCPAGKIPLGSSESEEDRDDDKNQVHVTLTKGFWMANTQVTQKQWTAIMGNNPSFFKGENLPVEKVSWHDAQEFLKKLNAKLGNTDGGQMVLPTEAQWEHARRAREIEPYSGGTIDEVAWYIQNSGDETHPVGIKKPNAWGLHDMHGNVWEWCADWDDDKLMYDDNLSGGVDPTGPSSGTRRLTRGGSWRSIASSCTSGRYGSTPTNQGDYVGFRVTRS